MESKLEEENELLKKELEKCKELLHKENVDELTGLYSRRKFFKETKKMLEKNHDKKFSFIKADIDRFQLINSFFGREEGDRLLEYFAYQLKQITAVSSCVTLGHIGADIFVACCQVSNSNLLSTMLQRGILALVGGYRDDYKLSLSAGIYNIEDNSMPIDVIYSKAIVASKKCKANYDVYYTVYDEHMDENIVKNQLIVNEMHSALTDKLFSVYLQPKCDLTSGKIVGAEALVRWIHPERGILLPSEFIPVFETNGFISKLDEYVWDQTCAYIRSWIDAGIKPIPVSVNVSRIDLHNTKLPSIFKSMLEKYEIPIEYLHLEITESAYSENPRQIVDAVKDLKDMGFHIEMDDFGTGYSSLNILSEMSIHTLKLDMSFIQGQGTKNGNGPVINFIVRLAKQLDLLVVAEGVETSEQINFLRTIGCDIGQGYFFSKPLTKEDFDIYRSSDSSKNMEYPEIDNLLLLDMDDLWFSNSKFNFLFNNFVGALALYEVKGSATAVLRANDEYLKMIKCPKGDSRLFGGNIFSHIHPYDVDRTRGILENLTDINSSIKFEIRISTLANADEYLWVRINVKVAAFLEDSVVILASLEDITEETYALKKLRKVAVLHKDLKKQLSIYQAVGGTSVFTAKLCETLVLLYGNDHFYEMHGVTREYALENADTVLIETVHPEDASRVMKELKKITSERKEFFQLEFKILTGEGKIRRVFASGRICYDEKDPIMNVVVNDISYL